MTSSPVADRSSSINIAVNAKFLMECGLNFPMSVGLPVTAPAPYFS